MTTAAMTIPAPPLLFSRRTWDRINFALRTWLASILALFCAYNLQLDTPHWAWLTVWLVAQPTPGMLLSKSFYLVIGTMAGGLLGIALIALFAQSPELFVLGLALLIGGCTVASGTLTNFRAYATVLAGYTSGLIAADAVNAPDQVFFLAMSRCSCILVGIACSILVSCAFAPYRSEKDVRKQLLDLLKEAAHRAAYSWQGLPEVRRQMGKQLIEHVVALNTLIEFAAAESGKFRLQANSARSLLAHIFSVISARRSLDAHLFRYGWPRHTALEIFHEVVLDFLNELPEKLDRGQVDELITGICDVRRQLSLLDPEKEVAASDEVISQRLVIDRMDDLLEHLGGALEDWRDIVQDHVTDRPRLVLNFHRDLRAAWINGLRAFLAVSATGAFWIASAWTHGPLALVFVSVLMSLFSSQPHPDRIGWTFFKAGLVAIFVGLIVKYLLLPNSPDFELLALTLGLVLLPLGWVMSDPRTAPAAGGFSFVFTNMIRPYNPMTYDLSDTLNTGIAIIVGVLFGTLAYILVFPPDRALARRYVTYRIRLGLGLLARLNPIPPFSGWETRMYDRVNRLLDPENPSGTHTDEWLEAGLGALTLGNEILRLRLWLASERMSAAMAAPVQKVIEAFGKFCHHPQQAAAEVKTRIEQLAALDPGTGSSERRAWGRMEGALIEIDVYLAQHPRLLKLQKIT